MKVGDLLLTECESQKKSWTAVIVKIEKKIRKRSPMHLTRSPHYYYTLAWDDGELEEVEDAYMREDYYNFKVLVRA